MPFFRRRQREILRQRPNAVRQRGQTGEDAGNVAPPQRPLQQMNETELSSIRKSDTDRDVAYIQAGVVSAEEVRGRLASEPDSGYNGIDVEDVPDMEGFADGLDDSEGEQDPKQPESHQPAQDADWDESRHPRAENGQFGSVNSNGNSRAAKTDLSDLFQVATSNTGGNKAYSDFAEVSPQTADRQQGRMFQAGSTVLAKPASATF